MSQNQNQPPQTAPLTIVLTGGGSGGHITPLLSLARALKRKTACRLVYIGLKGDKIDKLKDQYNVFDETYYVSAGKFRRYYEEKIWQRVTDIKTLAFNVRDFFRLIAGTLSSWRLIHRTKPNVLFVKGGFVGVPVGIAAKLHGVAIVTHDSDAIEGLANRIVGRWAVIHATGMPARHYRYPSETVRHVGIPIDDRVVPVDDNLQKEYKRILGLPGESVVLLIAGGGLGARSINRLVVAAAPGLMKDNPNLHILHVSGAQHEAEVAAEYQSSIPRYIQQVKVISFSSDFYLLSGAADMIITRAGATALAEFAYQSKACLVIPSPHLAGGHQTKNAEILKSAGAVRVLPNNAAPSELRKEVNNMLDDKQARDTLAAKLSATAQPGAADKLADILIEVSQKTISP